MTAIPEVRIILQNQNDEMQNQSGIGSWSSF